MPGPRDAVVIGADATVDVGSRGERVTVRRLQSEGSINLHGGSLRSKNGLRIDGEINVIANTTLRAGKRFHLGAITESEGARLVLRGPNIFISETAAITGLSLFHASARNELWFAGTATGPRLVLDGRDTARTIVTGTLDASNSRPRGDAGTVHILGRDVYLHGADIDARSRFRGGDVRIGGDYTGGGNLPRAERVYIDPDTIIRADAMREGDGGTVIVWSDSHTVFDGTISASAGRLGGDGGLIETSSRGLLSVGSGLATAVSARGEGGLWLMDPYNVTIAAGANDNAFEIPPGQPGDPITFLLLGANPFISTTGIVNGLNSGTSVTITTFGAGVQAGDITILDPIGKTMGGNATLTLQASNNINVLSSISSSSGQLNLFLQANSGADDLDANSGSVSIVSGLHNTNGGSVQISGVGFTHNVTAGLSSAGGAMTIAMTGGISIDGTINAGSGALSISSATANISADTSISAGTAMITAPAGFIQVTQLTTTIGAATLAAAGNLGLGSSAGGGFSIATTLTASAASSGTGSLSFGNFMSVNADTIQLRAGNGPGGPAAATVNVISGNPVFRSAAGGATSPTSFEIRQDAAITDLQIPGTSSFGASTMPANLSLQSDDGALTITSPAKVLGVNLTVASFGSVSLGVSGQTMMPANLNYDNTPPSTIIAGTLQTSVGELSFPSNVVLNSASVSIVSPDVIEFLGTINGGSTLSVTSPVMKDFIGAIGDTAPLTSLSVSGGLTRFYSNVTAATITVNTAATIFYTVMMTASIVGPIFQSTVTVNGSDELHIRGASPQFNGGIDSVSGTGVLSIAPSSPAMAMDIGGTFLTAGDFAAIAPGFTRTDFGTSAQAAAIAVLVTTFQNNTRFLTGNGNISHQAIAVTGGGGVAFIVSGAAQIIHQGTIDTAGGPILIDGPIVINSPSTRFTTTFDGAAAGADITFTGTVLPGDGQFPSLEFGTGTTGLTSLGAGLGTQFENFDSLTVYGGENATVRSFGDIWLGLSVTSVFISESAFELGADLTFSVTEAGFLTAVRSFGMPRSLTIGGGGDVEFRGSVDLLNLDANYSDGQIRLVGNVNVSNSAQFNGEVRIDWDVTISASNLDFFGTVNLNQNPLTILADSLNIGGNIFGGGGVSTLTIAPTTDNQTVSINEIDEGLWLSALELSRIQEGLTQLIFGRVDGTGQLAIGTSTFSDPVEFRMAGPGSSIRLVGALTGTDNTSFSFVGSGGTTTLFGNITTESEPIVFNDAVLIAVSSVTLSTIGNESAGADIIFNLAVNSTGGEFNSLSLQAGIGDIQFNGAVGGMAGGALGTLGTDFGGGFVRIAGGLVNTSFNQNWNKPVLLEADALLQGGLGNITINAPMSAGVFNLTLKSDEVQINAPITGSGSLKLAPFSLNRDVYINISPLGSGALTIDPTEKDNIEDGWDSVTYGEDDGTAEMVVGGGDFSDPTSFVMDGEGGGSSIIVSAEMKGSDNGTIIIRGGGSTTHLFASIITEGNAITILDSVILRTALVVLDSSDGGTFPMGGKIEVHGPIDSQPGMGHSLLIDAGLSELELFGPIGNSLNGLLGTLTTGDFSTAILRGGIIKTIGEQLYQGPVQIPVDLFLSTLGAEINFEEEVMGEDNLTIGEGSGETTFDDESNLESLTIETGDTRTFNGPVTIGTLTILGGVVNFNAEGVVGGGTLVLGTLSGTSTVFIDGEFEWAGGLVEGDGLIVIRPSGVFSFGGASERTLARDIDVLGTILWTSGHLFIRDAEVHIMSGGLLDVRSSGTMLPVQGSQGEINNEGLIERTHPGAAAIVDLTVTNTGEIRITDGSLKIEPVSGTFTNAGVITLGPVGSLIVRGDYVQLNAATLNILIAGTGTAEFGRLIVLGEATIDGTVATFFVDEFAAQAGDEFHFLISDARAGTFAVEDLDPPPAGLLADVEYPADGARLVISSGLRADADNDGEVSVNDIFAFLNDWFSGNGDFNGDGESTVDDIFAFLTAWFES